MTLFKEFPFLSATASELLCNETGNISVINVKTAVLPWNREVNGGRHTGQDSSSSMRHRKALNLTGTSGDLNQMTSQTSD